MDGGVLHARAGLPDRWDVSVMRVWTPAAGSGSGFCISRKRLARAIRQDIWREVQQVRGFVPRVSVTIDAEALKITAGGVLMAGRIASGLGDDIAAVLDHPERQRRWLAFARTKGDACSKRS